MSGFTFQFLVWSVYTASHMVPPLLSACTQFRLSVSQYFFDLVPRDSDRTGLLKQSIPADLAEHVFCTHRHSFDTEVSFSNLYWNPSYFIQGLPRFVKIFSIPSGRTFVIKCSLISFTSIYRYNTICKYCSVLLCKISTWSMITFQYYK